MKMIQLFFLGALLLGCGRDTINVTIVPDHNQNRTALPFVFGPVDHLIAQAYLPGPNLPLEIVPLQAAFDLDAADTASPDSVIFTGNNVVQFVKGPQKYLMIAGMFRKITQPTKHFAILGKSQPFDFSNDVQIPVTAYVSTNEFMATSTLADVPINEVAGFVRVQMNITGYGTDCDNVGVVDALDLMGGFVLHHDGTTPITANNFVIGPLTPFRDYEINFFCGSGVYAGLHRIVYRPFANPRNQPLNVTCNSNVDCNFNLGFTP